MRATVDVWCSCNICIEEEEEAEVTSLPVPPKQPVDDVMKDAA